MTVLTDVERTGDTVTGRLSIKGVPTLSLSDFRKPAYAYLGAADFALEQVKALPSDVTGSARKLQARIVATPEKVKGLGEQSADLYTKLALRGQRLVTSIRRQPATEAAIAEGKEAVRKTEAAAVAAKKSAKAGGRAVESAAAKLG